MGKYPLYTIYHKRIVFIKVILCTKPLTCTHLVCGSSKANKNEKKIVQF